MKRENKIESTVNDLDNSYISLFLKKNQQFITWSVLTDHSSYFITIHKKMQPTRRIGKKKENKNKNKKKKKNYSKKEKKRERKRYCFNSTK